MLQRPGANAGPAADRGPGRRRGLELAGWRLWDELPGPNRRGPGRLRGAFFRLKADFSGRVATGGQLPANFTQTFHLP